TTSKQRKVVSTIKNIEADARKKNIKSPGVIVVGEVCTLSEKFNWYENLPLHGMKILVTRPSELSSRLSSKLYNKGAEVVNMPSISTHKLNNKDFSSIIDKASSYEWIVFTSPTGARIFFEKLIEESIDIRKLSGIKFAAVGNATAKVIKDMGIIVEFVPSRFDGQTLGRELKVDGKVLIIRGTRRSEDITIEFSRRGIVYRDIPVYETNFESSDINYLDFDYITFTSGSTVEGFVLSTKARDYSMVNAICIGEQTESIAKKYNMNTYTAAEATLDSMVKVLEEINEVRNNGFNS
ncbi:MAG: uroporphyrinogen-III synthase, partial [Clostridium sp.]